MAISHADVARKLMRNKPAAGSRMYGQITNRALYWPSGDHHLFTVIAEGVSYRTTICKVVVNHHTQLSELWVSPLRYSSSTSRHEGYYVQAFIERFMENHGCDRATALAQVFHTPAVNDLSTRCNPEHARRVLKALHEHLPEVDKPRLRSATRMGALESARGRLRTVIGRMTRGVPVDATDAETLYECQAMLGFLDNTIDMFTRDNENGSIAEVRLAVRAWLTLNDPKNQ